MSLVDSLPHSGTCLYNVLCTLAFACSDAQKFWVKRFCQLRFVSCECHGCFRKEVIQKLQKQRWNSTGNHQWYTNGTLFYCRITNKRNHQAKSPLSKVTFFGAGDTKLLKSGYAFLGHISFKPPKFFQQQQSFLSKRHVFRGNHLKKQTILKIF